MSDMEIGTIWIGPAKGRFSVEIPRSPERLDAAAQKLEDNYHEVRDAPRDPLSRFAHEPPIEWLKEAALLRALAHLQRQIDELAVAGVRSPLSAGPGEPG